MSQQSSNGSKRQAPSQISQSENPRKISKVEDLEPDVDCIHLELPELDLLPSWFDKCRSDPEASRIAATNLKRFAFLLRSVPFGLRRTDARLADITRLLRHGSAACCCAVAPPFVEKESRRTRAVVQTVQGKLRCLR